jgi:hypothetical protein
MRVIDNFLIGSREGIFPRQARVTQAMLELAPSSDF